MSTDATVENDPLESGEPQEQERTPEQGPAPERVGNAGLGIAGVVAVLVSARGGIVPFVGPLFSYDGDGSPWWHWGLPHSVLALAPGVAGLLLGLFVIAESRGTAVGEDD
jgi:hypothetical protein